MKKHDHRETIFVEDAEVLSSTSYPADQYILRLAAPECAKHAGPGSFVHIQCGPELPMRRPLSIMRANADQGWIEVLYKIVGEGLRQLSQKTIGDTLSIMGPIGQGFKPDPQRPVTVMIGGGVGIPPLLFLAESLHAEMNSDFEPVAFFGSEIPFPFDVQESKVALAGAPLSATAGLALLDRWKIPSRLATHAGYAGCYPGFVTQLADDWLANLPAEELNRVTLLACGPEPMIEAAQKVAQRYNLPSQLCLEEFMACGVGGCAGCTVLVTSATGQTMKRVCVDGPVFDGASIYPTAM